MRHTFKPLFVLFAAGALIGLAGCDSQEPAVPLLSIDIIAPSDTVAFYFDDGARIASGAWFRSANGAPVTVSVETDPNSLTWDTNMGRLLAASPTTGSVRVTGSAPGHRDTTLSVIVVAHDGCPPIPSLDDYLPADGTHVTYDFYLRSENRTSWTKLEGVLSLDPVATCRDREQTVQWARSFSGIRITKTDRSSSTPPDTTEHSEDFEPLVAHEGQDNQVSVELYPGGGRVSHRAQFGRYQDLGGANVILEEWFSKLTLAPGQGITSVSFDGYIGSGVTYTERWTRR